MKKKHLYSVSALALGIVMLSLSVLANAGNISGYNLGKEAVKSAFFMENYTFDAQFNVTFDGKEVQSQRVYREVAKDSSYTKTDHGAYDSESWEANGQMVSTSSNDSNKAYNTWNYNRYEPTAEEKKQQIDEQKKMLNFMELLADTIVGDMKNNVISETRENGDTHASISLTGAQIPELYNAGLSMIASRGRVGINSVFSNDDTDNGVYIDEMTIKSVNGFATIDTNNNFKDIGFKMEFSVKDSQGVMHDAVMEGKAVLSNIGTTAPQKFDPTGKNVKDPEKQVTVSEDGKTLRIRDLDDEIDVLEKRKAELEKEREKLNGQKDGEEAVE